MALLLPSVDAWWMLQHEQAALMLSRSADDVARASGSTVVARVTDGGTRAGGSNAIMQAVDGE